MQLFGTLTSPYVRRVRIVARELGIPFEMIATDDSDGQARLRAINPLWRVPTAKFADDDVVFDSAIIVQRLMRDAGSQLALYGGESLWDGHNLIEVVDGALDSAINHFYFAKDGVDARAAYFDKQAARVGSAMTWIEAQLAGYRETPEVESPSLFAVALQSMLDWMVFRGAYDINAHPRCIAFRNAWRARSSFAETHPPA